MTDGNLVRTITIAATGENIDSTKSSVEGLGDATQTLSALTTEATKRTIDLSKAYDSQVNSLNDAAEGHRTLGGAMKTAADTVLESAAAYYAKATAMGIAIALMSTVVGILGTLYLAYKVVTGAIGLVTEAWRLGGEQIKTYVDLAAKAETVSVDFYQRITKAATDAKKPVDSLLTAFKTLNESTAGQLGGSVGQNRLDELTKAGNFKGNTGVAAFEQADSTESKYRATLDLINQAMDKGERLAALDIAKTLLGPEAANNLAKDGDFFNKILTSADAIDGKTLVSKESVDNAVALQAKYDAAVAILEQRWHPIQDLLTKAGLAMRTVWVDIVSSIASAVDWAAKLVEKLITFPYWDRIKDGLSILSTGYKQPEGPAYVDPIQARQKQLDDARSSLGSQLGNPANVAKAGTDTLAASYAVRKDVSKKTNQDGPDTSAYDRAVDSLQKYIETTNAAASSVDATVGAQERLKAIAQLTAAGMRDGLTQETAKLKAEMSGLGEKAGAAADALAKARIESTIKRDAATALLSPEDVAIANQLKEIYPNVTDALNSSYASQIRFNNALKDANDTGRQLSESFATDFTSAIRSGSNAWDAFAKAGTNALNTIADKLIKMEVDKLWNGAFGGSTGGISLFSLFGGLPAHASGTDSAPGGWSIVGENGPELMNVQKGAQILPNGVSPSSSGPVINYTQTVDARGADSDAVARLAAAMAKSQRDFAKNVLTINQKYRDANPGTR